MMAPPLPEPNQVAPEQNQPVHEPVRNNHVNEDAVQEAAENPIPIEEGREIQVHPRQPIVRTFFFRREPELGAPGHEFPANVPIGVPPLLAPSNVQQSSCPVLALPVPVPISAIEAPPAPVLESVPEEVHKQEQVTSSNEKPEPSTSNARPTRMTADRQVIADAPQNVLPHRLRSEASREKANLVVTEEQANHIRSDFKVPDTYIEAMGTPEAGLWKAATDGQMAALMATSTYIEVDEKEATNVLPCRFVLTVKRKPGGPIQKFEARCVCPGFRQKEGIDYWNTLAPTSQASCVRVFLTVALLNKMQIHQMDVTSVFLQGDIDGIIFVRPPKPYCTPGKVWRLQKALYGLKQAPRCWKRKLDGVLADLGYSPTKKEPCVYIKQYRDQISIILSYVDDFLVASNSAKELEWTKKRLAEKLEIRDLGPIDLFLGVQFTLSLDGSILESNQQHYIETLVDRYRLDRERPVKKLPSLHSIDLTDSRIDESLPFRELIGGLLYIASFTRPDISAALSILSQHLDRPTRKVWTYAKQVLGYLRSTKERNLVLGDLDGSNLTVFADANFAPRPDRRSQTGIVIKLAGSTVLWQSQKQKLVTTATAEAEFVALGMAMKKIRWIQQFLEELNFSVIYPTPVFEDNMPALHVATNQKSSELSKSIDIKWHAIQEAQHHHLIDVRYIKSEEQLADALTKVPSRLEIIDQLLGLYPRRSGSGGVLR